MIKKIRKLSDKGQIAERYIPQDSGIFLYDSSCFSCNGWISVVNRMDQNKRLYFAALTSPIGSAILLSQPSARFCFVTKERTFVNSEAIIECLSTCGGILNFVRVARLIPKKLRDILLNKVASILHSNSDRGCKRKNPNLASRVLHLPVNFE